MPTQNEINLINACKAGDVKLVSDLLEKQGTNINFQDPKLKATPLKISVVLGKKELFDYLISCKPDVNIKDGSNSTVIMNALDKSNLHMVQCLLQDKQIDLTVGSENNTAPIDQLFKTDPKATEQDKAIANQFISLLKYPTIIQAIKNKDTRLVETILRNTEIDVNYKDPTSGKTLMELTEGYDINNGFGVRTQMLMASRNQLEVEYHQARTQINIDRMNVIRKFVEKDVIPAVNDPKTAASVKQLLDTNRVEVAALQKQVRSIPPAASFFQSATPKTPALPARPSGSPPRTGAAPHVISK